jgi:hypothetical protein
MYDLQKFALSDIVRCGTALRSLGTEKQSMEEVAGRIVRFFYDSFVDKATGKKNFALVRFYKTHAYGELPENLQQFASKVLGSPIQSPAMKCLTLLATVGDEAAWNSRKTSVGHQAIPLASVHMVEALPMVAQLIKQLGMDLSAVIAPDASLLAELEQKSWNVFHVADAQNSPYVPAKKEFVIPFAIKSVVGFGGLLPSGNLFAVIGFAKVPIPKDAVNGFKNMTINIKVAVLPFDGKTIFAQ